MQFYRIVEEVKTVDDLAAAMQAVTAELGFQYFAIAHHVDAIAAEGAAIRLHNYPTRWADYYERNALGVSDPVHRASHVTGAGFRWSRMPDMIPLTADDRRVLQMGREEGIGDGFTIPANVPGEARGSCSFASEAGRPITLEMLPLAQLAGTMAFEGARRLWSCRGQRDIAELPVLTDRQRLCLMWAARGKTDWEISIILDVTEETIARHIKMACVRYGVRKRSSLLIRALFDGTLTFSDIYRR